MRPTPPEVQQEIIGRRLRGETVPMIEAATGVSRSRIYEILRKAGLTNGTPAPRTGPTVPPTPVAERLPPETPAAPSPEPSRAESAAPVRLPVLVELLQDDTVTWYYGARDAPHEPGARLVYFPTRHLTRDEDWWLRARWEYGEDPEQWAYQRALELVMLAYRDDEFLGEFEFFDWRRAAGV